MAGGNVKKSTQEPQDLDHPLGSAVIPGLGPRVLAGPGFFYRAFS
jgi:hypothetical protein